VKYEVGDKIIVLHSDEEGKVVEIINDKMVMIEVRGVKFPAYMDQIDFPYFKMFTSQKIIEKKKIHIDDVRKEKQAARKKVADGVFINFVPVYDKDVFGDEYVQKLKIYLINHNEEDYLFKYNLRFINESHFELNSELRALADFYLHDIEFFDISDNPSFDFEFSLSKTNSKKSEYLEKQLKLRGKQLYKKIEEIQEKNEPSFSYELFIHYPNKIVEPKLDLSKLGNAGYKIYDASKIKSNLPQPRSVVDLHIDKLVDFWQQMTNAEILDVQMSAFEKYLDLAKLHQMQSIIFIHGIGEGKLKDELHERLRHEKFVMSFVNQYHHLYGYGATEVFLEQN
jgi:hypothetical protein